MNQKLFSLYDVKADCFTFPFVSENSMTALRSFHSMVKDPKYGNLHDYPEDYSLWFVGSFDTSTGKFASEGLVKLGAGSDVCTGNNNSCA